MDPSRKRMTVRAYHDEEKGQRHEDRARGSARKRDRKADCHLEKRLPCRRVRCRLYRRGADRADTRRRRILRMAGPGGLRRRRAATVGTLPRHRHRPDHQDTGAHRERCRRHQHEGPPRRADGRPRHGDGRNARPQVAGADGRPTPPPVGDRKVPQHLPPARRVHHWNPGRGRHRRRRRTQGSTGSA